MRNYFLLANHRHTTTFWTVAGRFCLLLVALFASVWSNTFITAAQTNIISDTLPLVAATPLFDQQRSPTAADNQTEAPSSSQQVNAFTCANVTEIPQSECAALVALYNSTNGAGWLNQTGWFATNTPCTWQGIQCAGGRVVQIRLASNRLRGVLPTEVGNLSQLQALHLDWNQLSGSLPITIGNLLNLRSLVLHNNQFTGTLPATLGNLSNLGQLVLASNQFTGALPPQLGNLANLYFITLDGNQFSGALPDTFVNLTGLNRFWFHNTNLCEPTASIFQTWLSQIPELIKSGIRCTTLLGIYALAFDNNPTSTGNLDLYYTPTVNSIVAATVGQPLKKAIVLVDRSGRNDTSLLLIQNGVVTPLALTLAALPSEVNMADGATIGKFIQWARQQYPTDRTLFSYIGHGVAVAPEFNLRDVTMPGLQAAALDAIALPVRVGARPDLTDYTDWSVLSIRDLEEALRLGTNNGATPIDVVDLGHCFAATFEEFYALRNYAATLTGGPNYAFFEPAMIGAPLAAMNPADATRQMASTVIATYDVNLPAAEHPRLSLAVEGNKLTAINTALDNTAAAVLANLTTNRAATKTKLLAAYRASAKYDTTLCAPQDWALDAPDALVDLVDFADQLINQFGATSDVGLQARTISPAFYQAMIERISWDGQPWFAGGTIKPQWRFSGRGLALWADFQQATLNGASFLQWQSHWYHENAQGDNPAPHSFLQQNRWDNVIQQFWADQTVQTVFCLPTFPPIRSAPPKITMNDVVATENAGQITLMVTLSHPSTQTVKVNYSTANLTALASSDYTAQSGLIEITAGRLTATLSIPLLNDSTFENTETFLINLSNPINGLLADGQGNATIYDDDIATVRLRIYQDNNADGTRDNGEAWVASWTVQLYNNQNLLVGTQPSNSYGKVSFAGIAPGRYTACQVMRTHWYNSEPGFQSAPFHQPCYSFTIPVRKIGNLTFGNSSTPPVNLAGQTLVVEAIGASEEDRAVIATDAEENGLPGIEDAFLKDEIWLNTPDEAVKLYLPVVQQNDVAR